MLIVHVIKTLLTYCELVTRIGVKENRRDATFIDGGVEDELVEARRVVVDVVQINADGRDGAVTSTLVIGDLHR